MQSKVILGSILAIAIIGGAIAYTQTMQDEKSGDTATVATATATPTTTSTATPTATQTPSESNLASGSELSLIGEFTDYSSEKLAFAEKGDVVLFFSAPWCPTCQAATKNFNASTTPDGLTILKLDYDTATEQRKKYGVTIQHTFVQVDKDGNLIKKWSGSNTYAQLQSQVN